MFDPAPFWPLGVGATALTGGYLLYRGLRGTRAVNKADFEARSHRAAERGLLYLGESLAMDEGLPRSFLGSPVTQGPLFVEPSDIRALSVVGSMGTGKSVGALAVAATFAATHFPRVLVVYVDCKGDEAGPARTLEQCSAITGGTFRYFSILSEPSHAFPAVESIAESSEWPSDFAQYLQEALRVGAGLDHDFFASQGASLVEDLLALDSEASSFERLYALANDPENKTLYPTQKRWENTEGLRTELRRYASIPQLNFSRFDTTSSEAVRKNAISFERILAEAHEGKPAFVYFRMPRGHGLVPLVLRSVYEATKRWNTQFESREHVHVLLICDEVHRALGKDTREIDALNSLSRSISLVPLWVFQSFTQLAKASGEELARAFFENPVFYFGANDSGYSDELFLREREVEWWNTDSEGNLTRHTKPGLRPGLFSELASGKALKHSFLARLPRAKRGASYSLVRCIAPLDVAALAAKGWFKRGELQGAVEPERVSIFGRKKREPEREPEKKPRDPGLDDIFGKFT